MPQVEYLSDVPDRLVHIEQGWGELGFDVCAHSPSQTPLNLQIGTKHYRKGLGNHAAGVIVVDLEGRYLDFDAEVGVQKQPSPEGSVIFSVYVDGKKRFDSGVMVQTTAPKSVHIQLERAQELRLVANDAGDGIICDCADWADARLTLSPAAKPSPRVEFDVAPFAQVTTWDPMRMDGARAARIEEFHAEDVFLDQPVRPSSPSPGPGVHSLPDGVPNREGMNGYGLPVNGCIGLLWLERRRPTKLTLEFCWDTAPPDVAGTRVEAWTGMYPFQGSWKPLAGLMNGTNERLTFTLDPKANGEFGQGFRKVRWVLPRQPLGLIRISKLTATFLTRMKTATLRLEAEPNARGIAKVSPFGCELPGGSQAVWDTRAPKLLTVRYPVGANSAEGPTQPGLRFVLPPGRRATHSTPLRAGPAATILVSDALAGNGVYLRDEGIYVARSTPGNSLKAYKKLIAGRKTILQRVREMPDQTFAQAMKKTYREVHFGGPTLLSLGSDNWKWLVEPDGSVEWEPKAEVAEQQMPFENRRCSASIRFNGMPLHPVSNPVLPPGMKRWMPVASLEGTAESHAKDVEDSQSPHAAGSCRFTAFVAPMNSKGLFVGRIDLDGAGTLDLRFLADRNRGVAATVSFMAGMSNPVFVLDGHRQMAIVDTGGLGDWTCGTGVTSGTIHLAGSGKGTLQFTIPGWDETVQQAAQDEARTSPRTPYDESKLAADFIHYWNAVAQEGMQIQIPDKLLSDIIETSRIRCIIDARNQEAGARLAPWIAEIHYGPLESEANTIIRGMALMGHREFSEKCLDYFINLYNPAGYLTTGYTLVGTGWHLWTLGEAFALTKDKAWMKRHAADVARVCYWVVAERRKTMKLDPLGNKPPQFGLVTPGVIADWNAYQYYFYSNGTYCAGLEAAGRALKAVGYPQADSFIAEAAAYRKDIVRAYRWAQARTPAVALQDGTWVSGQPSQVHCPGPLSGYYAGEDGSRSWCYDVEVGPHNLVQQGILPPDGKDAAQTADHLEDDMYLKEGWGDYPAAQNRADWFDLGGFSKVQPYYSRMAEVYAMRDDVKPFLRSYFNMLAALIDPSNLTIWEHFDHMGAPDKTHETGVFLQQTRFMFVKERGQELWLAPMVTNDWMQDGMVVSVRHASTFFGETSYRIESHVAKGTIDAVVDPPAREAPSAIVIRLRHPKGLRMKSVTVNGKPWRRFSPGGETVTLPVEKGPIRVRATY
ncbi:MAG: NPCBM/NEW2 domain-containing protein [Fimbriimonadales bacterium]